MPVDVIDTSITLTAAGPANIAATPNFSLVAYADGSRNVISNASKSLISSDSFAYATGIASTKTHIYFGIASGGVGWVEATPTGFSGPSYASSSYSPRDGGNKSTGVVAGGYFYYRSYLENGWLSRLAISASGTLSGVQDYSAVAPIHTMQAGITSGTANTIYGGGGTTVKIIDGATAAVTRSITGITGTILGVSPTSNGQIYVFSDNSRLMVSIYDAATGTKTAGPTEITASYWGSVDTYAADFRFCKSIGDKLYVGIWNPYYSGGAGMFVKVFDTKTNTVVNTIPCPTGPISMAFCGSNAHLLTNTLVQIFDTGQGGNTSGFFSMF